ncbi:MAG: cbb3-type cytochrome c oxidase subunit 3 [Halioglobus sp.]|nr:cbb3-type cytochrome c oxidase subunit 3 [Halioglobus sp.]
MDINDLRGLSTALLLIAFIGMCIWAYSHKRKADFDEAANLPFADEEPVREGEKEMKRHG